VADATTEDQMNARYPSLAGRSVLITGGATGIGASVVAHFVAQGSRVAFLDIDQTAGQALAERTSARFVPADVTDIASLRAAIETVGAVDVLVNNAARDDRHRWQDVTPAYWDERIAVNLRHQFFATQAVAPGMIAAGRGSVINMGSTSWRIGIGGMPAYTASKAGIEALTRSFARDLGPHRIRVNCVLPGWVMTERQLSMWVDETTDAKLKQVQCLPDRLYPPDIARMVLWLAADDSRMATNQTFVVDGGWI